MTTPAPTAAAATPVTVSTVPAIAYPATQRPHRAQAADAWDRLLQTIPAGMLGAAVRVPRTKPELTKRQRMEIHGTHGMTEQQASDLVDKEDSIWVAWSIANSMASHSTMTVDQRDGMLDAAMFEVLGLQPPTDGTKGSVVDTLQRGQLLERHAWLDDIDDQIRGVTAHLRTPTADLIKKMETRYATAYKHGDLTAGQSMFIYHAILAVKTGDPDMMLYIAERMLTKGESAAIQTHNHLAVLSRDDHTAFLMDNGKYISQLKAPIIPNNKDLAKEYDDIFKAAASAANGGPAGGGAAPASGFKYASPTPGSGTAVKGPRKAVSGGAYNAPVHMGSDGNGYVNLDVVEQASITTATQVQQLQAQVQTLGATLAGLAAPAQPASAAPAFGKAAPAGKPLTRAQQRAAAKLAKVAKGGETTTTGMDFPDGPTDATH